MRIVKLGPEQKRARRRERALKTVAVLPSLATLGNLICGVGAIYMCMLSIHAAGGDREILAMGSEKLERVFPTFLSIGAYLIVLSMFFDGIDGRLARFTRKTSEFGAQLDSLADVVSFGVAPAMLVITIAHPGQLSELSRLQLIYWRAEWVMAAVFVCCAALRLARFNVENVQDESAHMGFRGLPSPGAAGAIVGLVIFHQDTLRDLREFAPLWAPQVLALLMPPFAMLLGLLMVSRFRYPHIVNAVLRGRRPFRQVVALLIVLLIGFVVQPQFTLALTTAAYALSGPIAGAWRRFTTDSTTLATQTAPAGSDAVVPAEDDDSRDEFEDTARHAG